MKDSMSSIKGASHHSREAKRRLYCKLQMWTWRKRRENCFWGFIRGKNMLRMRHPNSCLNLKTQSRRSKRNFQMYSSPVLEHLQIKKPTIESDQIKYGSETMNSSQTFNCPGAITHATSRAPESIVECDFAHASEVTLSGLDSHVEKQRNGDERPVVLDQSGECCPVLQEPLPNVEDKMSSKNTIPLKVEVDIAELTDCIQQFLHGFFTLYGSFIPLEKSDVLRHLKRMFNADFTDRRQLIYEVVKRRISPTLWHPITSFQVVFKKHTLSLDDLSTLANQNWLNDQVINMYGELIMEAAQNKVHFLNSFFHRQLMTKGYDGVKRWTKQVDLFSKSLLLVPIHLEVHWCLVTTDIARKKICLFDSQGSAPHQVAQNILKYVTAEAREKQRTSFVNGWAVSYNESVPQQTNENDCGVFVLEYSRCLALARPLCFSQRNIPKIRKRIYKELCGCKLYEQVQQ
ncbi:sentrin-specific protease 5-like isoform X2 [Syngnathoides biaculeatus]|uniref:sentrin-specific protease 5-like isoform X2 n=1 Tax=Syngnathoides biaculeatus TaxID=300417 RepID=UPI002ADD736C|nr:sentrin-specific protease 5-like isoform X2 [Syngnathoides biaculeatus]